MRPITPGELARQARTLEDTFPQEATVTIPGTITKNSASENVQGAPTVFTMPCRAGPESTTGSEQQTAGYTESSQTWEIAYPRTFLVPATATLVIEGVTYEVIKCIDRQAYETVRRVSTNRKGGTA